MNNKLGLRDIDGIDAIGWWPIAPGWWIVIGIMVAIAALVVLLLHLKKRRQRWQYQMLRTLDQMIHHIDRENAQTRATEIAELIRRLAIHRFSRNECAHLQGRQWIEWLTNHDPKKYNWNESSIILIEAPFQPNGFAVDLESLQKTILATKGWVQ